MARRQLLMTASGGGDDIWMDRPGDGPLAPPPVEDGPGTDGSVPVDEPTGTDPGSLPEGDEGAGSAPRRPTLAIGGAAIAIVALLAGYGLGLARGRTEQGRGTSPTTSIVRSPETTATASTQPTAQPTGVPSGDVPTLQHALGFDDGVIPTSVEGAEVVVTPGWVVDRQRLLAPLPGRPDDVEAPALPGVAPVFAVSGTEPITVATVSLTEPTGFSGLTLGDEVRGWQLVVTPDLDEIRLYEVRDGVQQQRASLVQPIDPATNLGLYVTAGGVGVVVQGRPVEVKAFFGDTTLVASDHPPTRTASLVAGMGQSGFDAFAFG
jgi:hypothetical protein